ncbi:MAG: thiol reductase thioredoxin [Spirochaetes bacterium]|nr:thiol reductase thioredoxin [Spirochaetota bacterium]
MDKVKEIEEEICLLERELSETKGRETEVYTRIVGYYRAVKNWNKGKREEYNHRICFSSLQAGIGAGVRGDVMEEKSAEAVGDANAVRYANTVVIPFEQKKMDDLATYSYFYKKACPNCPAVKKCLDKLEIRGETIDVDTPEGISIAAAKGVLSVPTVIFSNTQGKEVYRTRNANDLKGLIPLNMVCAV